MEHMGSESHPNSGHILRVLRDAQGVCYQTNTWIATGQKSRHHRTYLELIVLCICHIIDSLWYVLTDITKLIDTNSWYMLIPTLVERTNLQIWLIHANSPATFCFWDCNCAKRANLKTPKPTCCNFCDSDFAGPSIGTWIACGHKER